MTPAQSLEAGAELLRTILEPHGFRYVGGDAGSSSGGAFASGAFMKQGRTLEFSVRHGLGQVEYILNGQRIGHENYLRYAGHWGNHRYPGFGHSVLDSFAALAEDIQSFLGDFTAGDGAHFIAVIQRFQAEPNKFKGFSALRAQVSSNVGRHTPRNQSLGESE